MMLFKLIKWGEFFNNYFSKKADEMGEGRISLEEKMFGSGWQFNCDHHHHRGLQQDST
jgi:hypothetical protein